jgi:hypothetical protein
VSASSTLGSQVATANASGVFNFTVAYTEPTAIGSLTVSITQSLAGGGSSPAATVSVHQGTAGYETVNVTQASGSTNPTADYAGGLVVVQVFATASDPLPLQQTFQQVSVDLAASAQRQFRLPVSPNGGTNYYFLAFRASSASYVSGDPVSNSGTPTLANVNLNNPPLSLTLTPP